MCYRVSNLQILVLWISCVRCFRFLSNNISGGWRRGRDLLPWNSCCYCFNSPCSCPVCIAICSVSQFGQLLSNSSNHKMPTSNYLLNFTYYFLYFYFANNFVVVFQILRSIVRCSVDDSKQNAVFVQPFATGGC